MNLYVVEIDQEYAYVIAEDFEGALAAARTWWLADHERDGASASDVPIRSCRDVEAPAIVWPDGREIDARFAGTVPPRTLSEEVEGEAGDSRSGGEDESGAT